MVAAPQPIARKIRHIIVRRHTTLPQPAIALAALLLAGGARREHGYLFAA